MWFDVKIFSFAYFVIESWKSAPGYFLGGSVEGGRWKSPLPISRGFGPSQVGDSGQFLAFFVSFGHDGARSKGQNTGMILEISSKHSKELQNTKFWPLEIPSRSHDLRSGGGGTKSPVISKGGKGKLSASVQNVFIENCKKRLCSGKHWSLPGAKFPGPGAKKRSGVMLGQFEYFSFYNPKQSIKSIKTMDFWK